MVRQPGTAVSFEWDDGNVSKLARRGIRPEDFEAVLWGGAVFRRNKRSGTAAWWMTGRDAGGRLLGVAVLWGDPGEGVLRAISARPL